MDDDLVDVGVLRGAGLARDVGLGDLHQGVGQAGRGRPRFRGNAGSGSRPGWPRAGPRFRGNVGGARRRGAGGTRRRFRGSGCWLLTSPRTVRKRFRGNAVMIVIVAGGGVLGDGAQRGQHCRAVLGRQPDRQRQRPVVVEPPGKPPPQPGLLVHIPGDGAVRTGERLQLVGRHRPPPSRPDRHRTRRQRSGSAPAPWRTTAARRRTRPRSPAAPPAPGPPGHAHGRYPTTAGTSTTATPRTTACPTQPSHGARRTRPAAPGTGTSPQPGARPAHRISDSSTSNGRSPAAPSGGDAAGLPRPGAGVPAATPFCGPAAVACGPGIRVLAAAPPGDDAAVPAGPGVDVLVAVPPGDGAAAPTGPEVRVLDPPPSGEAAATSLVTGWGALC